MTAAAIIVGVLAVLVGATVQGSIGFGVNLIAAPLIVLVEPSALPGALIITALPLSVAVALRDREHRDLGSLRWMLLGAVPGTVVGVAIVKLADVALLTTLVGAVTLAGVVLSALSLHPRVTALSATVTGLVSQTFGTSVAVGGPPVALLYQREPGALARATMSHFFAITASLSLFGLVLGGQLTWGQVRYAALLIPAMVAGLAASGPLRRHVDAGWFRTAVLVVCTLAGATALVRGVAG